jgi:hypothetical protein
MKSEIRKTNIMKKLIFGILVLLLGVTACKKDEANNVSPTRVVIKMHDQPANYQQVNIDLQKVIIKGQGQTAEIELDQYAGIYNLLDLQNGLDTLIGDTIINFGYISQVRLVLGPNNTVMVDSVLHPLQTPSAQQSGLKINVHADVSAIDTFFISLDFDALESVHQTGNGTYQLHPVIHLD